MSQNITEQRIECPHCGHHIRITLDASGGDQNFYDECLACCKEIHVEMHLNDYRQKIELKIDSDDEQVF